MRLFMLLVLGWLGLAQAALAVQAGTRIDSRAYATFHVADLVQPLTAWSPTLWTTVASVEALTLTGATDTRVPPGAQVVSAYVLSNTGNMASEYTFTLNGSGCSGTTTSLSGLRLAVDSNNNGVADAGEWIATGTPSALKLRTGGSANLLVVGSSPVLASGLACISLTATTVAQSQLASSSLRVHVGTGASVTLNQTASYSGPLLSGTSVVGITTTARNIGTAAAAATSTAGPVATPVLVNGAPSWKT